MGKKDKQREQQLWAQIMSSINQMNQPTESERALQTEGMKGLNFLNSGDYRNTPTGMVFDFSAPAENQKRYEMLTNAKASGTSALGGESKATALSGQYLQDKFARDEAQNYQQNIAGVANKSQALLGGTADAEAGRRNNQLNSLMGMYNTHINKPKSPSIWGNIIGAAAQIGSSAITAGGF